MTEWITSPGLTDYPTAVAAMEDHVARVVDGTADERIWLLEHPPIYTAGTSAKADGLRAAATPAKAGAQMSLDPDFRRDGTFGFPVYQTGRGGQYTYHGPGQRVAYVMLDLKRHYASPDIRRFVYDLEEWIIRSLAVLGVTGERREGRIGIWVVDPNTGTEAKIAALGIRVRRGVSYHGISINVNPDLTHFNGIIPCGINEFGVTSLNDLKIDATMDDLDQALKAQFSVVFGAAHPNLFATQTANMMS